MTAHEFWSMGTTVRVLVPRPGRQATAALRAVERLFAEVHAECTRFDPSSPLMRANAAADEWYPVPARCFAALRAAYEAHVRSGGVLDPRVLRALCALGYDRSLDFGTPVSTALHPGMVIMPRTPWRPGLDGGSVRIGPHPVDLGGIAKGLAVRWAAHLLGDTEGCFAVEAGGDCYLSGAGPQGMGWSVGVEDPTGGADPVAVLSLADRACATSSIGLRRWSAGCTDAHHLIDPTTGRPGGAGLLSVTVIGPDPAWAEVWSKVLFLRGTDRIAVEAELRDLAALWVTDDGRLGASARMSRYVTWRAAA